MSRADELSVAERLVLHVHLLEQLEIAKQEAAARLKDQFTRAKGDGFDPNTLKVVLKLRKMTTTQRQERRALESLYMAALGMLEGEALPEEARRRLDPEPPPAPDGEVPKAPDAETESAPTEDAKPPAPSQAPAQPVLVLKTPEEARQEGKDAAAAGKRIYDNPYPAGDANRAAWDEGWCAQRKSHGMDTPSAYQRRSNKPAGDDKATKDEKDGKPGAAGSEAGATE